MKIFFSMVVLIIHAQSSRHTLYLEKPVESPRTISLISCTLVNSWSNLEKMARFSYNLINKPGTQVTGFINPGNYTLETLKLAIIEDFESNGLKEKDFPLRFLPNHSTGGMILARSQPSISVAFDNTLADLLGLKPLGAYGVTKLKSPTGVIKLKSPEAFYIFCDLVKGESNLLDGKPSELLARFDIKGKLFETVSYPVNQAPLKCVSKPLQYVQAISLRVCDKDGNLIDFYESSLCFILEIETFV